MEKNDGITLFQKKDQTCYFSHCVSRGEFFGDVAASKIKRLSRRYIGGKILDIGAGSGALIDILPKGAIGMDLSPKHPAIIKGDIGQMPFDDETFDTVFAIEVLEHLDEDTLKYGLKEASRILQIGGNFIITVPFKEDLKANMVICPKCGIHFHKVGHVHSFSQDSLTILLKNAGLMIKTVKVLPLGIMARYPFVKHFLFFLEFFFPSVSKNIFMVATKYASNNK